MKHTYKLSEGTLEERQAWMRARQQKRIIGECAACGLPFYYPRRKFCSVRCGKDFNTYDWRGRARTALVGLNYRTARV